MSVLKASEVAGFINNPPTNIGILLVYGPNEGRISDIISKTIKSVVGSLDDPFNLVSLTEKQLKETPGILRDEVLSLSFTGGRKVISIKDPGMTFSRALPEAFEGTKSDNLLIIQAGSLKKSAAIRKYCEKSPMATCIACYEDTRQDLAGLVVSAFEVEGNQIDTAALNVLIDSVGNDRMLLISEVEKLVNYVGTGDQITVSDIEALSGDLIGASMDELCDLALTGDTQKSTQKFHHLSATGILPAQILNVLAANLAQLQKFRVAINKGQSTETVLKAARPPVFFKRQPAIKRQLTLWHDVTIKKALSIIYDATLLTRRNADLSNSVCERALIAISKTARVGSR